MIGSIQRLETLLRDAKNCRKFQFGFLRLQVLIFPGQLHLSFEHCRLGLLLRSLKMDRDKNWCKFGLGYGIPEPDAPILETQI